MAAQYFGVTDTGRVRDNNEDAFITEKIFSNRYVMACVIDGVGGYEGGEVAAGIARQSILEYFSVPSGEITTMLKESLSVANQQIYAAKLQNPANESMACVLTLAIVDHKNNKLFYAHVGDTRMYLFRDASLVKITKDHSFIGFLEDSGKMTEAAAMAHPKRNEINKALGFDPQFPATGDYVEVGESPFLPGDVIMLCSDGLTDMISNSKMAAILSTSKSLEAKTKELVDAANEAGGKDNITVVLVQNNSKRIEHSATKPEPALKKIEPEDDLNDDDDDVNETPAEIKRERRSYKRAAITLSILSILLAALCAWLFFNKKTAAPEQVVTADSTVHNTQRNAAEQQLSDSLISTNSSILFLSDSVFNGIISVTDTFYIKKDSLHIIANGLTLKAADGFNGPAFLIDTSCKYLMLEGISFENFNKAISAPVRALHFKDVRFNNCNVAVEYALSVPSNKYLTGNVTDANWTTRDSILKVNKK
jgi:serine/threonine protein phosphatase PrpC